MLVPFNVTRVRNYIGKSSWSGDNYFHGDLDDLRIYNRALTEEEILSLFQETLK